MACTGTAILPRVELVELAEQFYYCFTAVADAALRNSSSVSTVVEPDPKNSPTSATQQ